LALRTYRCPQVTSKHPNHEESVMGEKQQDRDDHGQGPKYFVNLEGNEVLWDRDSISVSEIRTLAGWDASQPVIEVDLHENTERTLPEDAVVALKPGQGFAKKIKFKRG
jgi:hypothetical protein